MDNDKDKDLNNLPQEEDFEDFGFSDDEDEDLDTLGSEADASMAEMVSEDAFPHQKAGETETDDDAMLASAHEDEYAPAPEAAAPQAQPEDDDDLDYSDELISEMQETATGAGQQGTVEKAMQWAQENKMLAGGGLAGLVIVMSLVTGGGEQKQAPRTAAQPSTSGQSLDNSLASGKEKSGKSDGDFFSDDIDISDLAYKPREVEDDVFELPKSSKPAPVGTSSYVRKKLKDIDARLSALETGISDLQSMQGILSDLNIQVNSKSQKVTGNEKQIRRLELALASLNRSIKSMEKDMFRQALLVSQAKEDKGGKTGPEYVVQASIPGRAWLVNRDGILITVREGQEIPGFGKVTKINPKNGEVTMSTNVVFQEEIH